MENLKLENRKLQSQIIILEEELEELDEKFEELDEKRLKLEQRIEDMKGRY